MKFSRLLVPALALALTASLIANAILYQQGEQYYRQLNETRLDPLGLRNFANTQIRSTDKIQVVFYGDSRAANWPEPAGLEQFEFVNRGVGAQTSAQMLGRFEQDIAPLLPNIVVLQVGINDLKTIPLFPERRAEIIAGCKTNIKQAVDMSVALGAKVILTTIFPVGPVPVYRQPFWSPEVARAVDDINAYIQTLSAPDVIGFDAHAMLAENGETRKEYAVDTLHLNSDGYAVLNSELVKVLKDIADAK